MRGRSSCRPCPRHDCPHSPALPWPPPPTPSLPRPSSHSPAPALVPVRWTVRVDDALNGARRPLVQQPMRRTSTYAHNGATRVSSPGRAEPPRSQASVGEQPLLGPRRGSPTVEAHRPSRLADRRGSSTVRGRRCCRLCPCHEMPSLPSLTLAVASHTVLASAVLLSLACPRPQVDRQAARQSSIAAAIAAAALSVSLCG